MITNVPSTWGESDTPLLPRELERPLKKLDRYFLVERSVKGRSKLSHYNYASLARNFDWRKHLTSEELIGRLNDVAPLLRSEEFERWLDFPALPKFRLGDNFDITRLGLLRRTHLNLKERDIDLQSLVPNLEYGSFLTIFNLTDDFVSTLDLVTGARNHIEAPLAPKQPETLDGLLIHLVHCILLEHGMERVGKNIDNIQTIVGLRIGLHNEGIQTLQAISDLVGLTGERVRRIFLQWTNVEAELDRVWPMPPILDSLLTQISQNPSWGDERLKALLETEFHAYWKSPCQTVSNILQKFEISPSLALLNKNELVPANSTRGKFDFPSAQVIRRSILHSGGKSCFSLIDDVVDDLSASFPDIPADELRQIIRENAIYGNLPLGYVFASGHREQITPVSRALLMLAWAGELSIDEIRAGLDRYGRFRKMPPAPPSEVLKAFYQLRSEFEIEGDLVRASVPTNRDEDTVEGQIALFCEQQDGMVVSKALVQDHFRRLGRYTSSASLYMSFSPILRPAGVGCITLVGHSPTADELDAARKLGSNLTIESHVSWHSDLSTPMMEIFVGTAFRDSGVISISAQKARWLRGRRFRVLSNEQEEHGTLSVSGNFLYGFSSFFNAKQIDTADTIQVELNTRDEVAHIRVNEFVSDF